MHLFQWLTTHFQSTIDQAHKYHVDPKTFLLIYLAHYPLVWAAFAWIIVAFRRKQNITTQVSLWIFTMLIPWFYPLFFGKLPWYYDAALVGVMAFIVLHGYHKIHTRLATEKQIAPPGEVAVEEAV